MVFNKNKQSEMDNEADVLCHGHSKRMDTTEANVDTEAVSSSAPERRKSSKPIMEKRRRARINASLTELKTFLLDIIKKEGLRHNKMEKADILELTVKHLRQLQREQFTAVKPSDGIGEDNFGKGFTECASEVTKFLKNMPDIHPNLQARLLEHLVRYKDIDQTQSSSNSTAGNSSIYVPPSTQTTTKVQQLPIATTIFANNDTIVQCMEQVPDAALQYANISTSSTPEPHHVLHKKQHVTCSTGNQSSNAFCNLQNITDRVTPQLNSIQQLNLTSNNLQFGNIGNMISGFQIIPTRLESGQTAYIIPTNIVANTCIPNYIVPVLPSTCINPASRQIHQSQQPETSRTSSTSPETSRTSSTSCVTKTQNNIGTKYTHSRSNELNTKDSTNRLNINMDSNFTPTLGYLNNHSTTTNDENGHTSRDLHNCHTSRDLHENSHTSRDLHDPVDQHIPNEPLEDNVWRPW